jgi:putative NADH-flavin reductase
MNIAVVGANGRTGQLFIQEALRRNNYVRAAVHKSNNLDKHPNLTIFKLGSSNYLDLVSNQDAVVSFMGHVKGSQPDIQTEVFRSLILAMRDGHVKRLVSLTGTGVRFPGDKISLLDRILNMGVRLVDPRRVKDGLNHVELIKNSDLDWTIIRVLKLQNTKPKTFILSEHGPAKFIVSRNEVAIATLNVLDDNSFIRKAPIISK